MNTNQKEHDFKYSKSILGLESLSVLIVFVLSAYFYFERQNLILSIILLLVGISNLVYYLTRISNNKTQLKINSNGLTLKKQFLSWNQIKNIEIDRINTGKVSGEFLTISTKSDKVYDLEISELNITSKKLKEIINKYKNIAK
ncbi:hypothetical protein [Kaistella sp.]|uniref:hypothetical protein n=1 Tax=Kaistella sp. TaxID=2782235 RepID=UPI003C51BD97